MIFVQAAARPSGPASACFDLVTDGHLDLFVSGEILNEVTNVLSRSKLRRRFTSLTDTIVEGFVQHIQDNSTLVPNVPLLFDYPRDPKDEKYINLAAYVKADFLVTRDSDLLDLTTGIDIKSKEFRQRFRNLRVVEPVEFISLFESQVDQPEP